jgi:hypothetical protein
VRAARIPSHWPRASPGFSADVRADQARRFTGCGQTVDPTD